MASLAELSVTANAILAAFISQLEDQHVDVPERRYVHSGSEPVWDQAQITVGLVDIRQGQPGVPVGYTMQPYAVNFYSEWKIILLRTVPTLGDGPVLMPPEDELGESGFEAMTDVAALVKAFSEIHLGNTLTSTGEGFVLSGCHPLGTQGGLTGTELLLEMSLR